jgi:hypothetical protein
VLDGLARDAGNEADEAGARAFSALPTYGSSAVRRLYPSSDHAWTFATSRAAVPVKYRGSSGRQASVLA